MGTQKTNIRGEIEVICGSMFSGKTKLLIKKIREAKNKNLVVSVFKPKIDTRYNESKIVSHEKNEINATPIKNASDIIKLSKSSNLIAIDEVQFFDDKIIETCKKLSQHNKHVILAGLDMDYLGNPFGPMPKLIDLANNVISLNAICDICNKKAYHTYRKSKSTKTIMLGEKKEYLALCRQCFNEKTKKNG